MAKKKRPAYVWIALAAIILIGFMIMTSAPGSPLAKFWFGFQPTVQPIPTLPIENVTNFTNFSIPTPPETTITYQGVLDMLNKCEVFGWTPGAIGLSSANGDDLCSGARPGSTCTYQEFTEGGEEGIYEFYLSWVCYHGGIIE